MKVLVIDDDLDLCASLRLTLSYESTVVDFAHDGEQGFLKATNNNGKYDVIILDNNLPKQNGFTVCSRLRQNNIHIPILILSIANNEETKVNFLDTGADDYLVKPFSAPELSARLRALVRRGSQALNTQIKINQLILDTTQQVAFCGKRALNLPRKQYLILEYLVKQKNKIVSRQSLASHVWGDSNLDLFSNALEAHICELRKQLRLCTDTEFIHTINGRGYKFVCKT